MTTITELKQRIEEFLMVDPETSMTVTLSHPLGNGVYTIKAKEFLEWLETKNN